MTADPPMDKLAPGVLGYAVETDEALFVPAIMAERPGRGDVGRFLDSLPRDRTVKVPAVLSPRLAGMLDRRGFKRKVEWAAEFAEYVEVWVRGPD